MRIDNNVLWTIALVLIIVFFALAIAGEVTL